MKMMLTVTLLVCAMMALTNAAVGNHIVKRSARCPSYWTPYKNRCFIYVPTAMTWAHAEKSCQNKGGNLASVHSFEEHHVIQAMILQHTHAYPLTWLGGYDAAEEGIWLWSDGSSFNFLYWATGEPNNSQWAHCLVMNFGDQKKFDDNPCNLRRPFVCAKKL